MRNGRHILLLMLALRLGAAPTAVDMVARFEAGSNTDAVTTTILGDSTLGTGGAWSLSGTITQATISTVRDRAAVLMTTGGATDASDAATRSVRYNNSTEGQYFTWTFTDPQPDVSLYFSLYLDSGFTGASFGLLDFIYMAGASGEFSAFNYRDAPGAGSYVRAHTQAGTSTEQIVIAPGKWYGVCMRWDKAGLLATVRIYDTTVQPWSLVGTSTLTLRDENCTQVRIGRTDSHEVEFDANHHFGAVAIATDGTWPLLPGEAYEDAETARRSGRVTRAVGAANFSP